MRYLTNVRSRLITVANDFVTDYLETLLIFKVIYILHCWPPEEVIQMTSLQLTAAVTRNEHVRAVFQRIVTVKGAFSSAALSLRPTAAATRQRVDKGEEDVIQAE